MKGLFVAAIVAAAGVQTIASAPSQAPCPTPLDVFAVYDLVPCNDPPRTTTSPTQVPTPAPSNSTSTPTTTTPPSPTTTSTSKPTTTKATPTTSTSNPTTTKASPTKTTASPTQAPNQCGHCTNCYYPLSQSCYVGWTARQCTSVPQLKWCGY
ncbi:hypothetical protein H257_09360 [Aphanomyces astaci]|uniref:CBM1 domain-containing protein n=1 Tax=Aphanomyces astaci TaxID=112090 RepID=W4GBA3_APHAT|nr:hypothetical protein H257_09360 [Aphanomyces astaci]ETV76950.1 hypothetical protein H257_09360 [Aphanomyces astaci]|eukprot:XP_009833862.1 hypothetical protein H257_09360 [Aphanomyces astaci]